MSPRLLFLVFCTGAVVEGVRIVVDLKLKCNIPEVEKFKGMVHLIEGHNNYTSFNDLMEDRVYFRSEPSMEAEATLSAIVDDDKLIWTDEMEPKFSFLHTCHTEKLKYVREWVPFPKCPENKEICHHTLRINFRPTAEWFTERGMSSEYPFEKNEEKVDKEEL